MQKQKTLKQIEAKERRAKKDHSRAYLSPEFKGMTLAVDDYLTMTSAERHEYDIQFTQIAPNSCGNCFRAHIFGGYCSEEGETIMPLPQYRKPTTRAQRRGINPNSGPNPNGG